MIRNFKFKGEDMNGLFSYYSSKKGDYLKSIVSVDNSSRFSEERGVAFAIVNHNFDSATHPHNWISGNKEKSNFTINLHAEYFKLESYSVKMRSDDVIKNRLP